MVIISETALARSIADPPPMPMIPLTRAKFLFQIGRQPVHIDGFGLIGNIRKKDLILSPERDALRQGFIFKKLIQEKDHGGIPLPPGG